MNKILNKINRAGLRFLEPITPLETFSLIVEEATKLLDADLGQLYLCEKNVLEKVASFPKTSKTTVTISVKGFIAQTYKKQKAVLIDTLHLKNSHPELHEENYKSAICIPISDHKKSIGVLLLLSCETKKFTKQDLELLNLFGAHASLAIRKAKLLNESKMALAARDFFLSMAAHELRTPLTSVNGYAQLLHTRTARLGESEAKWVKQLVAETRRMTLLINELLEIDTIKKGKLQYNWKHCDLIEIIHRTIENLHFIYPTRNIVIKSIINPPAMVIGDYDKLLSAVTNLLENAIKFSPKEKPVMVSLQQMNSKYIITIIDKGKGIPQEKLDHLFEGYANSEENDIQGLGLGLYLVKNILRVHRGTLEIKTKVDNGTKVIIKLPKAP